jgi:hypothetical protein
VIDELKETEGRADKGYCPQAHEAWLRPIFDMARFLG